MKKAFLTISCLLLAIPCLSDPIDLGDNEPDSYTCWKTLGGNFKRTGLSEKAGPELGCVKWKFQTEGSVSSSITVGSDGRIHIACEDGILYTLAPDSSLLWSYDANSPLFSSPSIGPDGTVYVGSQNGELHAIDPGGNLRWTYSANGPIYSSPAVSTDGNNIYVGSQDGTLYTLDSNGIELWTFTMNNPVVLSAASIFASPTIDDDGTVYIGALYDPNLYALDPETGNLKWKCNFESGGWPFTSPVIAKNGTIYQSLIYDSNLYAIDSEQGTIIWSTNLADPCSGWFESNYTQKYSNSGGWSEPVLGPDWTIYVSLDDPYLRAVEPNGNIKWVTRLGTVGGFTLTVDNYGWIYAASDDGYIYVIDANGWEIARFKSDGWLNFPVIVADNLLIVTDSKDNSMLITAAKNAVWAIGGDDCYSYIFDLHWIEDLDADGDISLSDFALLAIDWLKCTDSEWPCQYRGNETYLTGDIDRDKYVFFSDLSAMVYRWLGNTNSARPPRPPGPFGPPPGWPTKPMGR